MPTKNTCVASFMTYAVPGTPQGSDGRHGENVGLVIDGGDGEAGVGGDITRCEQVEYLYPSRAGR
jgi:hypothetical protein